MSELPVPLPREKDLLLATLDLPTAERPLYLEQACLGDEALKRRVQQLLSDAESDATFMHSPAVALAATSAEVFVDVGAEIDRYRLMEQLGEGGMGVVFVAEQTQPVRRKVALKVIKPGMDSKAVIARFEAERQALALMDHPNICRVLDAGTTSKRLPFFVMELVRGMPINAYCDQTKASLPERLRLFLDVCSAVQHAHQKGIIHRDLKPTNILITLHDGTAVVKVIDFGVAKALHQQLTTTTLYTAHNQVVGTPLYMSPEQLELSGLDVDTRADIYSLGVLLYELISGTTPFEREQLFKSGFDEMRRIIREEDPPRPSYRITTMPQLQASTVANKRGLDQRSLVQTMKSELDWIVLRALEKDRNRRYSSAADFAADVKRYLDHEAVQACPPSFSYRTKKFVRKNQILLSTAALIGLAMCAGTVASTWSAVQAIRSERRAVASDRLARQAVDEMYTGFAERWLAEQGNATRLQKEFLEKALNFYQSVSEQNQSFLGSTEVLDVRLRIAAINQKLGNFSDAEHELLEMAQLLDDPAHSDCSQMTITGLKTRMQLATLYSLMSRHDDARQEAQLAANWLFEADALEEFEATQQGQLASEAARLATLLQRSDLRSDAEKAIGTSERIWRGLLEHEPYNHDYRLGLAKSLERKGLQRMWFGDRKEEAELALKDSLRRFESLYREDPTSRASREGIVAARLSLGVLASWRMASNEAIEHSREGIQIASELAREFTNDQQSLQQLATLQGNLLQDLSRIGQQAEADEVALQHYSTTKKLAELFPSAPDYLDGYHNATHNVVRLHAQKGEYSAASKLAEDMLLTAENAQRLDGQGNADFLARISNWCRLEVAKVAIEMKRFDRARDALLALDLSQFIFEPQWLLRNTQLHADNRYLDNCFEELRYLHLPAMLISKTLKEQSDEDMTADSSDVSQKADLAKLESISVHLVKQSEQAIEAWRSRLENCNLSNDERIALFYVLQDRFEEVVFDSEAEFRSEVLGKLAPPLFETISERLEAGDTSGISLCVNALANGNEAIRNPDIALKLAKRQLGLTPMQGMANQDYAFALLRNRHYQECLDHLDLHPAADDPSSNGVIAIALWHLNRRQEGASYLGPAYDAALEKYCKDHKENAGQGTFFLPTAEQLRNIDQEAKRLYEQSSHSQ